MRKLLFAIILLFTTPLILSAQSITRLEISKPYAVLNFIETAAGTGPHSTTLRAFITQHISRDDTVFSRLVQSFSNIRLNYNYTIDEYPANRRRNRSTYNLLIIAAVKSPTLAAFHDNSIGLIPNSEHTALFRALQAAEVYYDRILWNEYQPALDSQLIALKQYEPKAGELFTRFKHFYNSAWNSAIPFHVALVPIPGRSGNSTATPHANSLCVGVLTGKKDHLSTMGVVLHEMCHVLYDEQTSGFQQQLDSFFRANASPYRDMAYSFFDEALATALGNGWAYQYIAGDMDTTAWYNNAYIDGFAHAIYPMVNDYLISGKTIDRSFVNKAIDTFAAIFPNALTDYAILLNNMYLYADAETQEERLALKKTLEGYFQSSRYNFSSPVLHEYSIRSLKTAQQPQLVVVDRNHKETMAGLLKIFPEIKKLVKGHQDPSYVLSFTDQVQRPVVIVYVRNKEDLDKAFKLMHQQQFMRADKPYSPVL